MITITPLTNNISKKIAKFQIGVKGLKKEALDEFVSLTPVRTGNARRHTILKGNAIEANYSYANRLDDGYSRQAPNGMVKPFSKWLSNRLRQIFSNKG